MWCTPKEHIISEQVSTFSRPTQMVHRLKSPNTYNSGLTLHWCKNLKCRIRLKINIYLHMGMTGEKEWIQVTVEKARRKTPLGRPRCRWVGWILEFLCMW
jgi:hypothetical protein